jgi:adenosylhomocysteine nucleosidase
MVKRAKTWSRHFSGWRRPRCIQQPLADGKTNLKMSRLVTESPTVERQRADINIACARFGLRLGGLPATPRRRLVWLAVVLFLIAMPFGWAGEKNSEPVTGILGAMPVEIQMLESRLEGEQAEKHLNVTFHTGTLNGRRVVLAASGIGKVNAAMTATLLLDHFHPSEVLLTGVAGGINPKLAPGDIVIGEKTAQHDHGELTSTAFHPQPTGNGVPLFMTPPERLLVLAEAAAKDAALDKVPTTQGERQPRVVRGVIVTGDVFVASPAKTAELRRVLKADAVEMEGAAVAQVCWQQNVPCLVIRCLSDKADVAANADFGRFVNVAATNSAKLTLSMLKLLAKSQSH